MYLSDMCQAYRLNSEGHSYLTIDVGGKAFLSIGINKDESEKRGYKVFQAILGRGVEPRKVVLKNIPAKNLNEATLDIVSVLMYDKNAISLREARTIFLDVADYIKQRTELFGVGV